MDWLRVNLAIGTLSFGSASRIVLYEEAVVRERGWLTPEEFAEVLTVAQLLPGPNLVNLSAYLGYRLVGPLGTVVGVLCFCLPGAALAVALSGVLAVIAPGCRRRSGNGSRGHRAAAALPLEAGAGPGEHRRPGEAGIHAGCGWPAQLLLAAVARRPSWAGRCSRCSAVAIPVGLLLEFTL